MNIVVLIEDEFSCLGMVILIKKFLASRIEYSDALDIHCNDRIAAKRYYIGSSVNWYTLTFIGIFKYLVHML